MFYDFIYLAKGFPMRPKVWSTFNVTDKRGGTDRNVKLFTVGE